MNGASRPSRLAGESTRKEGTTMSVKTEAGEKTAAEYLESAVEDLNQARQEAQEEARSTIDSAIGRARDALDDLRANADERAENLRTRAKEQASEWQRALEDATEDARRELGVRAVRAQRTTDALDAMGDEIKHHKKELK